MSDLRKTAEDLMHARYLSHEAQVAAVESALRAARAEALEQAARRAEEYPRMGLLASDLRRMAREAREG